jgi:hypothetical protein
MEVPPIHDNSRVDAVSLGAGVAKPASQDMLLSGINAATWLLHVYACCYSCFYMISAGPCQTRFQWCDGT